MSHPYRTNMPGGSIDLLQTDEEKRRGSVAHAPFNDMIAT
jgi:hypothetical protein